MTKYQASLLERLKRLGFRQGNQIRLYGLEFVLHGDPVVMGDDIVLIDAFERQSQRSLRLRIPLSFLKLERGKDFAA